MDIILTDVYLGDIVSQIQQRVYIDEQKAKTTAGLIVAELFTPILEELKKKHVEKFGKMMTQPQKQSPLPQIQTQTLPQASAQTQALPTTRTTPTHTVQRIEKKTTVVHKSTKGKTSKKK